MSRVPTRDEMPSDAQVLINLFKYQCFNPFVSNLGSEDHQREKAEDIVKWWPGWIRFCLISCEQVLKAAYEGKYDTLNGPEFPYKAWEIQREVFQKAYDEGKYVEKP